MVFDQKRIAELGVTNVGDVLNYMPQQPFSNNEQFGFGGSRVVRLRGLGIGTTLVLINGRRTVTSALVGAFNHFDLNTIPLSAVERIEVLSDSASAVYGADAIGGVVNVILKDSIEHPTLDLYYGAAEGGGDERRASFAAGHQGDRLRVSGTLDYFERDFLLGADRDRLADQDYRRYGSLDRRSAAGNPGNITSRTAANLPGLSSRVAAIPQGSTGMGMTPADFAATAGQVRLTSLGQYTSIVPESQRMNAVLIGEFDVGATSQVFAEFMYANREDSRHASPPTLTNALVPAANPFNPFGVPVSVSYLFEGVEPRRSASEAESYRSVAGARGGLGSWEWELALLATRDKGRNTDLNDLDMPAVTAALASTNPAVALNLFADGPAGSPDVLASVVLESRILRFTSESGQASAFLRGALFDLPAGEVEVVVGAETRKEDLYFDGSVFVSADRYTSAAFTELRLPIAGGEMEIPALHSLVLGLAGRLDRYSDFGDTFNPQYGLEWRPLPSLLLRASHGTSFRPPSLFEFYQPEGSNTSAIIDIHRNNEIASITVLTGGNPDLEAEESVSSVFGFVWKPLDDDALRIGASYWRIEQDQRVLRGPTAVLLLANEPFFPERIVRDAPTPADIAAGLPGRLLQIDSSTLNFGGLETSGVDVDISASFDTPLGTFTPSLAGTWVEKWESADFPTLPVLDRVGVASVFGTIPEWRATATLGWSLRGISLGATARAVDSYEDATGAIPNGRTVRPQTLLDLRASMDFGQMGFQSAWMDGLVLRAGVLNALDDEPPFSSLTTQGYDSSQVDLRQRFAYASVSKAF